MARRGRASGATRVQSKPSGRVGGSNGARVNGSASHEDEPGARTIGAMALQRWAARDPGASSGAAGAPVGRTFGPYDVDDLDRDQAAVERVDFGAVQLSVPPGGEVTVEPEEGRLQAVHVMLPVGRLSVSALAAPRSERLWPDLAREIDESLRDGGATVRSFTGEWGRELHARTGGASSVFVGVDGPRWLLYGVATGPTDATAELDAALRRMLRGTVVVRGRAPYPVRTVLPLTVPAHLDALPFDPNPSRAATGSARTGLGETAVVPPVRSAAAPGADEPTGFARPPVDGEPTAPRGLPRVASGGGGARPSPDGGNGAGRNGAGRNGAGRNAAERTGVGRNGVGRNGAGPAGRNGAGPAGRNGAVRGGGTGHDEAARNGSPSDRRPDAGSERTARVPARPPQRRVADLLAEAERERTAASSASALAPPVPPQRPAASRRPPSPVEPPRWQPDDRYGHGVEPSPPVGSAAVDDDPPTAIGDVPLYDELMRPTITPSVPSPVERPPWDAPRMPARPPSDGSDDWTVPIPVIRPEPEPPRARRARRREAWADDVRAGGSAAAHPRHARRRPEPHDRAPEGRHHRPEY